MRRNAILRIGFAALFVAALGILYAQDQPAKLDTVKIKDDLYVIHNDVVPGNVTVLITNEGVILVDDKFDVDHANIMAELKKVTSQPVRIVVNTHHHLDHSGGNAKLQQLGVQAIAHDNAWRNMVEGSQPGIANVSFTGEAHLHLGGKNVDLYYYGRAHTNGDIVAYFPAHRVLSTGDIFAYGDATPELIDYPGGGSAKELTSVVDSALKLDFDTVVPGHGVVTTRQELVKYRDTSIRLKNRVHQMVMQNRPKADIAKMLTDEFHYGQFHIDYSLDGLMAELK